MVSVIKRERGKSHYYYIIHNSGKHQHEKYLGKKIPENIELLKREFLLEILHQKWKQNLELIKKEYSKQPKTVLMDNLKEFSYGFTYDTEKIEGSSLTKRETYDLLKFSLTPHRKSESDMIETKLHHEIFVKMTRSIPTLSQKTMLMWHKKMFEKTKINIAGKIRTYNVFIVNSDSTFPHWKFVITFLKDFFSWYKKSIGKIEPVELAGTAHFRFVNIHPFGDGNGRVSRLLMNYILIKNNYPPLNIKYSERWQYYMALERGNLEHDEIHFLKWFMKYYIKNNQKYL